MLAVRLLSCKDTLFLNDHFRHLQPLFAGVLSFRVVQQYADVTAMCKRLGKAPEMEIETSTFADNWKKALEQPQHADVVFVAEGRHRFKAHKIVLCSASQFFRQVLNLDVTSQVQIGIYNLVAFFYNMHAILFHLPSCLLFYVAYLLHCWFYLHEDFKCNLNSMAMRCRKLTVCHI